MKSLFPQGVKMQKVLIVEDELMVADLLESVLLADGFIVCGIARTVREALRLAEQERPDLALVDVHLADGLGTSVGPVLFDKYDTGILYMTGSVDLLTVKGFGCHAYLRKPFELSKITDALDAIHPRACSAA